MTFLLGQHFHRWPNPDGSRLSPAPTNLKYNAVRLHDGGVMWNALNPARGVYNWTPLDKILRSHPVGTFFVYTLYGTPAYALLRPAEASTLDAYGQPGGGGAAHREDVQAFITAMLTHIDVTFPNTINAIEVGNEPHYDGVVKAGSYFWGSAAEHVNMGVGIKMAITACRKSVELWSAGFRCGETEINAFLDAQSDIGLHGRDIIDALGWHPYSYELLPGDDSILIGRASVRSMRALMAAQGISGKKLYITEYGIDGWLSPRLTAFLANTAAYRYKYWVSLLVALKLAGLDGLFGYSYDNDMHPCGDLINDHDGAIKGWNDSMAVLT